MADKALQTTTPSLPDPAGLLPAEKMEAVVELLAKGVRPPQIAKKLYPKDAKKRKAARRKLWSMVYADRDLQARVAARAQAEMLVDLIPMTRALTTRAKHTGKPDAVKLAAEMVGFHTPKQKHEHSGEVKIKLDMPRPKSIDADGEDIVDADVVD
jgi:hypothetical protein